MYKQSIRSDGRLHKDLIKGIVLIFGCLASFVLGAGQVYAQGPPDVVYVNAYSDKSSWDDTHFCQMQDGIQAVSVGGTVYISSGYYLETVRFDKAMTLRGQGGSVIIDGPNALNLDCKKSNLGGGISVIPTNDATGGIIINVTNVRPDEGAMVLIKFQGRDLARYNGVLSGNILTINDPITLPLRQYFLNFNRGQSALSGRVAGSNGQGRSGRNRHPRWPIQ